MRIAIIGSRRLKTDISPYIPAEMTAIVASGEKGIGQIAERYADTHHIPKLIFRPRYFARSKKLPFLYLESIVNSAEMVLALWDGESKGTKHAIDYAQKKGVPIKVIILERSPARGKTR